MKVTNENLTPNEANINRPVKNETKLPKSSARIQGAGNLEEAQERIRVSEHQISKLQSILDSFRRVEGWIDRQSTAGNPKRELTDLIEKAQFRGERVLQPYENDLKDIVAKGDKTTLRRMISDIDRELKQALPRLDFMKENILAARSGHGMDELMRTVVRDLKSTGVPEMNLKRERVVDLLS
jgi:hypothetical protein